MAKLLHKEGNFKILSDDVGKLDNAQMMELVKTVGTTCYQSKETTKKTAEQFVDMFMQKGHLAMLDHTWFTVSVETPKQLREDHWLGFSSQLRDDCMLALFRANSLFCISARDYQSFLVSGNCRMFNEAWVKTKNPFVGFLVYVLKSEYSSLFLDSFTSGTEKDFKEFEKKLQIEINPELLSKKEILIHRAASVEFNNCSRGMTHETVRSRNGDQKMTAYAQESTRYVDYAKGDVNLDEFQMNFVLPYKDDIDVDELMAFEANGSVKALSIRKFVDLVEGFYRALRKNGLSPQEARQFLPIGLKAQIVQTYNLNEWRHWFKIRTGAGAHPEIRFVAVKLLKDFQSRMPGIFDFEISNTGESAKYIGEDPLV